MHIVFDSTVCRLLHDSTVYDVTGGVVIWPPGHLT